MPIIEKSLMFYALIKNVKEETTFEIKGKTEYIVTKFSGPQGKITLYKSDLKKLGVKIGDDVDIEEA